MKTAPIIYARVRFGSLPDGAIFRRPAHDGRCKVEPLRKGSNAIRATFDRDGNVVETFRETYRADDWVLIRPHSRG